MLLLLVAAVGGVTEPGERVRRAQEPAPRRPCCSADFFIDSSRRRIAMSAARAFAAALSSASPVSRSAFARFADSAAVRFSLSPSVLMTSWRTFAPRAADGGVVAGVLEVAGQLVCAG